jgi:hypothetical protein
MLYKFTDPQNTACITCVHVIQDSRPILHVTHDKDDGCWQFLCGAIHDESQAVVMGIGEMVKIDESLNEIADLKIGGLANRTNPIDKWNRV